MTIDTELNSTSENPVQNKVVNNALSTINNSVNNIFSNITSVSESNLSSSETLNEGNIILVYED